MEDCHEVEILLVEDNPYDAELTTRALRSKGLANKLLTFADGVEALDFLFGTGECAGRNLALRPKVILLDLKLPRINRMEILEKIRADERTKMIPVVILTSSQEESDIVRGYDLGEEGGYHFFVMEYIDGRSLKDLLREGGRFPEEQESFNRFEGNEKRNKST